MSAGPAPAFLNLGFGEMVLIGAVALLVFGGRLPEVMRNLGRSYARFREGMNELSRPLRNEMRGLDDRIRAASRVPDAPRREGQAAALPPVRTSPPPPYPTEGGPVRTIGPAPAAARAEAGPSAPVAPPSVPATPSRARPASAADEPPPV
jgi:TatA/E family protein of Tat protein translocase